MKSSEFLFFHNLFQRARTHWAGALQRFEHWNQSPRRWTFDSLSASPAAPTRGCGLVIRRGKKSANMTEAHAAASTPWNPETAAAFSGAPQTLRRPCEVFK